MIDFIKASTSKEREAINLFLLRHNAWGQGSTQGYVAYYAAVTPPDSRPLVDRIVAAAKVCPLHTPAASRFFAGKKGEAWKHVYCLQRLAAYHAPENLLSRFVGWILRDLGRDPRIHLVATYADTGLYGPDGRPQDGGIYRATNAVYCGLSAAKRVVAYQLNGQRHSLRKGGVTTRIADIPDQARLIRGTKKHRYCWAVGSRLKRAFRRRALEARMVRFTFEPVYQPKLLATLRGLGEWLGRQWLRGVQR